MPIAAAAHPVIFAFLTVAAIGFISYTILKSKKRKEKPCGMYYSSTGSKDSGDEDDDDRGFCKTVSKSGACSKDKSNSGITNDLGGLKRQNNRLRRPKSCLESSEYDKKHSRSEDSHCRSWVNSSDFNKNIDEVYSSDEDSTFSESNNNGSSKESFVSSNSHQGSPYKKEFNEKNESRNARISENFKEASTFDCKEKFYKRAVYENLKKDVENSGFERRNDSKSFNDKEFEYSEKVSASWDSAVLDAFPVKNKLCEGCEEELANAIAYPCKHCYLCLDCAFKVHRIYKKCTVCNSDIITYEFSQ